MRIHTLSLGLLALCACSNGSTSNTDAGNQDAATNDVVDPWMFNPPHANPGDIAVQTEEFTVDPGAEVLVCTYTTVHTTAEFITRDLESFQMPGGHHVLFMYAISDRPAGTHVCTEEDMSNMQMVGGGAGSAEERLTLPTGIGVRIPANVQITMQSHYLNLDTVAHRVRDAMVAVKPADGEVTTLADPFAITDSDMIIPPHAAYGQSVECTLDRDMNVVTFLGHTHQYGTHFSALWYPGGTGQAVTLYDEVAGERLRNNPPIRSFTAADAIQMHTGDRVRVNCDWNNTTDQSLAFPQEMCVGFGYYYPGGGFMECGNVVETRGGTDAGAGGDAGDGATGAGNAGCDTPWMPGDPCVRTCNTGNELGVGRYCTPGGGECNGNHSAIICTADLGESPGYCTKGCSSDTGCGSGAICYHDPAGSGCLPVECVDPPDAGAGDGGASEAGAADGGAGIDAGG